MRVKVARTAGFCWGVKRAVDRVIEIADTTKKGVFTLGPLIHNPQAIGYLESKGIRAIEDPAEATEGTLVYRAHGIPPQLREAMKGFPLPVSDATCPDVGIIAAAVKKHYRAGYHIVIFGDENHPEVVGLKGYAPERASVVRTRAHVEALPHFEKVCLVSQSTQNDAEFEEIAEALRRHLGKESEIQVFDTICEDTRNRQAEVLHLAAEVDAMVIVGGRNSANTRHLADLARRAGKPAFHVETEEELRSEELAGFQVIGVTAGASTPNWMIQRVAERIEKIEPETGALRRQRIRSLFRALLISNLFLSVGGAALAFLSTVLQGIPFTWRSVAFLFMTGLFVYVAHTFNQVLKPEALEVNEPARRRFHVEHRMAIRASIAIAGTSSLALAALLGPLTFAFMVALSAAAAIYRLPMIPGFLVHQIGLRSISDLPGSKDFFTAGAWATLIAAVPAISLGGGATWAAIAAFLLTFTLMFSRSVVFDLRDIRGDRMVGKETLPLVLGRERTEGLLLLLLAGTAGLLAAGVLLGLLPHMGWFLLLPLAVLAIGLWLYHRERLVQGPPFDLVVDGALHSAGLAALLAVIL